MEAKWSWISPTSRCQVIRRMRLENDIGHHAALIRLQQFPPLPIDLVQLLACRQQLLASTLLLVSKRADSSSCHSQGSLLPLQRIPTTMEGGRRIAKDHHKGNKMECKELESRQHKTRAVLRGPTLISEKKKNLLPLVAQYMTGAQRALFYFLLSGLGLVASPCITYLSPQMWKVFQALHSLVLPTMPLFFAPTGALHRARREVIRREIIINTNSINTNQSTECGLGLDRGK